MKTTSVYVLSLVLLQAQDGPNLGIQLHPESQAAQIQLTGEVGSTYVIESKTDLEEDFWLARAVLEMTTPEILWLDPVPADAPQRIYRAVKVAKAEGVQPIENMVWIPPGTFTMGSPDDEVNRYSDEGPQTRVTISKGFWMGKYELTQGQYQELMDNNPSRFTGDLNRPVEQVSWNDALAYCNQLTEQQRQDGWLPEGYVYRLPTEAEWEYACRAGTTTRFTYGDAPDHSLLGPYAWYVDNNSDHKTHPVGQKKPNPWGLYDMHGNVWEWCLDWWSDNLPGGSETDPMGPDSGSYRVRRGGNWNNSAGSCRSANRDYRRPVISNQIHGFRPVLAPALH